MTAPSHPDPIPSAPQPAIRIGHGYDLHRLEPTADAAPPGPARPFILGTVLIPHDRGPVAHSDGDALLHAVTDALLGAIAHPDIGQLFPDTDPRNNAQDSRVFLAEALARVHALGYRPTNLDTTVICERPKLSPHKDTIRQALADLLQMPLDCVNMKGKTHEQVDAVGENRAIEAHAVVLLEKT